jgi:hypothetical protein
MTMKIAPSMTDAHLTTLIKTLPDELDEAELCALTLTIYSAYMDEPAEIITNLIATIYSYGMSVGISHGSISEGLRRSASLHDESHSNQTAH